MRRKLLWAGVIIVLFIAYQVYQGIQQRRLNDWWEQEERTTYKTRKAEYAAMEASFRSECGDFIAVGSLGPSLREDAVLKMGPAHAQKCDAVATELNRRARELGDIIQAGRTREQLRGIR